jgi:hypothetical protein
LSWQTPDKANFNAPQPIPVAAEKKARNPLGDGQQLMRRNFGWLDHASGCEHGFELLEFC